MIALAGTVVGGLSQSHLRGNPGGPGSTVTEAWGPRVRLIHRARKQKLLPYASWPIPSHRPCGRTPRLAAPSLGRDSYLVHTA